MGIGTLMPHLLGVLVWMAGAAAPTWTSGHLDILPLSALTKFYHVKK
jgi:hypothetical protein